MNKFTGRGPGRTGQSFAGKKSFKDQNHHTSSDRRASRESEHKTENFSTTCSECKKPVMYRLSHQMTSQYTVALVLV
jgi:hypothetical protein